MVLLGVGTVAFAFWPRGPALVLYTSPPITLDKKTFRLQALVPAGWRSDGYVSRVPMYYGTPQRPANVVFCFVTVVSPDRPSKWMPEWMRTRLFGPVDFGAVTFEAWKPLKSSTSVGNRSAFMSVTANFPGNSGDYSAYGILASHGSEEFRLSYSRSHRAAFEATRAQIIASFRVIP
jgi:hypothetical protein